MKGTVEVLQETVLNGVCEGPLQVSVKDLDRGHYRSFTETFKGTVEVLQETVLNGVCEGPLDGLLKDLPRTF